MRPAAVGAVAGGVVGAAAALAARGPTLVDWPANVRTAFPFAVGGMAGVVAGVKVGLATSIVRAVTGRGELPAAGPILVGCGVAVAAAGVGAVAARKVVAGLAQAGRDLDPAFAQPPTSATLSGGPGSLVDVADLGREGARFVGSVSTPDDVRAVTEQDPVAEPVRVFVGVDAATSVEQRVELAMGELRRTGAFDRSSLLVQAPAGSGYANSFPVDVLEVLTRGDCAAVAIGYGLLPSFLSLNRRRTAALTQRLLLDAISVELRDRPSRPRILLYGESLGAGVQQMAVPGGPVDLDRYGVAAALWVGTPGGARSQEFHRLCADVSVCVDRPEQLPDPVGQPRPRVWFLEHDGDPVVRFRPRLISHRPAWLPVDGSRGRNVPPTMTWRPGITFAEVFVDTMFATNVKAGLFESRGHDYRGDLGAVVTAAFDLPVTPDVAARLEDHLRAKEIERAERIGEA